MEKEFNPTNEIGFFVGRTHRKMLNVLQQRFTNAAIDITPEQGILLVKLGFEDGISQQQIADMLCKEKSSAKRLIDSMERNDLILRIEDKKDRRNKLIYLTNSGKTLRKKIKVIASDLMEEINTTIDISEMQICKKVLSEIFELLDKKI